MLGKPLRTEQTPEPEDHLLYILIKEIKDFKHTRARTHTHKII